MRFWLKLFVLGSVFLTADHFLLKPHRVMREAYHEAARPSEETLAYFEEVERREAATTSPATSPTTADVE